jgi:hypothetical protein
LCYNATYNESEKKILLTRTSKKINVKCPSASEQSPFNQIELKNEMMEDGNNKTTIICTADSDIDEYSNFDLIMTFTKQLLYENYINLDNYITICN